ncbi:decaprenyl diphosphate synthase subunit Dps1 [Schizosaccharomyces japonicus yFS275]|uniref:Decaprenyl diphosphate synthase subunit Dps1 n=1 Tax=Schizosaccharomyces japonicus (strain yFS275 / FY16936) TaxID=402676 RepID=B6K762_SCHJY|nr:decaprenyl diphosphate synthase subunit Dps1 [Schizosaccharomyces japonicus yFS275]EEB09366.1 decaprenyl diphosphate synthase subunit Dps1 [Schizosaccharomyces japonicus yFS275]
MLRGVRNSVVRRSIHFSVCHNNTNNSPCVAQEKTETATLIRDDLKRVSPGMRRMLGCNLDHLQDASTYYTLAQGKQLRPSLVLLVSRAVSLLNGINRSVASERYILDCNPALLLDGDVLPSQLRLAQITEMIHVASLLHDDVIDLATHRRGQVSGNIAFGNQQAVFAGDFILARASTAMARLRNTRVTELLATVIADLIRGEFLQLRNVDEKGGDALQASFDYYLEKSYLKTASLISKSCMAAAVLGKAVPSIVQAIGEFGRCLGIAFQLVDDALDFKSTDGDLGKPANADLKLGLATAPVLFAWKQFPELESAVRSNFQSKGAIEQARQYVREADGVRKTEAWAGQFIVKAKGLLSSHIPDSPPLQALLDICDRVITRKK